MILSEAERDTRAAIAESIHRLRGICLSIPAATSDSQSPEFSKEGLLQRADSFLLKRVLLPPMDRPKCYRQWAHCTEGKAAPGKGQPEASTNDLKA
jgi:hypothetical protein